MTQPVDGWIQLHGGCYYDFNKPSLDIRLECWDPEEAKSRFLHECRRLGIR